MSEFDDIFDLISAFPERHGFDGSLWRVMRTASRSYVETAFQKEDAAIPFGPFGEIRFPYHEMGAINSLDLFGIDELILFAFYKANARRYKKVVDFGANIGLHSLLLSKCGFEVRSFEPDEQHSKLLLRNLELNNVSVDLHNAAVSLEDGDAEFVRVLGNTTGSHLKGAKDNAYGPLEHFTVKLSGAAPHLQWADLAKIDIEGHEAALLTGLPTSIWKDTDAIVEIGTADNAAVVFDYFNGSGVNLFSQKLGWSNVTDVAGMPSSHREGSLFISAKDRMPWD